MAGHVFDQRSAQKPRKSIAFVVFSLQRYFRQSLFTRVDESIQRKLRFSKTKQPTDKTCLTLHQAKSTKSKVGGGGHLG